MLSFIPSSVDRLLPYTLPINMPHIQKSTAQVQNWQIRRPQSPTYYPDNKNTLKTTHRIVCCASCCSVFQIRKTHCFSYNQIGVQKTGAGMYVTYIMVQTYSLRKNMGSNIPSYDHSTTHTNLSINSTFWINLGYSGDQYLLF
jgi:hypothetical protein